MSRSGAVAGDAARIPFWRNVKVIGVLAQIVFVAVLLAGVAVLGVNAARALDRANLPADFRWLDDRAGIPIAETPIPYTPDDPYWKALLIGFLNTLKVALVGVALASVLGVAVGVMRLASNWLVRTIATVYIELLRNIPLAVQIVFWYTAVLLPVPPRVSNPIALPGGGLLSNLGLAIPFLYPGYAFGRWWPWLVVAVVAAVAAGVWRARQARVAERPLRVWPWPVGALLGLALVGYLVAGVQRPPPADTAIDFNAERARGVVYRDLDGDDRRDADEPVVAFAPTMVRVAAGELTTATQNLSESRREAPSTFRFPLLRSGETETAQVGFVDEVAAEAAGLRIYVARAPGIGWIYVDRDGDGSWDRGEEVDPATGAGYNEVEMVLRVTGFERRIVADRDGQIRVPAFAPVGSAATAEAAAEAAPAAPARGVGLFSRPAPAAPAAPEVAPLDTQVTLLASGPLVHSPVAIPVTGYEGGMRLSVNYLALLFALVIYTSAFIGEIVRGGIQAVAKGQREAALALGLSGRQTFSLVVFPQALRIVLPPMISQFLNLTKNSSLAPLAAYAELFVIATITANQTGASVPGSIMLIIAYLAISLTFALVLNVVNDRLALVER